MSRCMIGGSDANGIEELEAKALANLASANLKIAVARSCKDSLEFRDEMSEVAQQFKLCAHLYKQLQDLDKQRTVSKQQQQ